MLLKKPTLVRPFPPLSYGPIGAYVYFVGFAAPLAWELPLLILAFCSVLATLADSRDASSPRPVLLWPVLLFLVATGVSIWTSADVSRSLRLSLPFLPALLLFFLISTHFTNTQSIRGLFLILSLVSLGLASALLWTMWSSAEGSPTLWVTALGSPLLVVPNDITLLAVTAPLSLALLYSQPRGIVGLCAALALVLSLGAICVFQSRIALLTLTLALTSVAVLLRPRLALVCGLVILVLVLAVESVFGFLLSAKFAYLPDRRLALWLAAWAMFCDAPLLGHGPHTFVLLYQSYLRDVHLPVWLPVDDRVVSWPHNLYLEILAEQGMVGFVSFAILLIRGLAVGHRTQRAPPEAVRVLGAGALAGLWGLCLAAVAELSLLRHWVVVMLFTLLGVIAYLSSSYSPLQTHRKEDSV